MSSKPLPAPPKGLPGCLKKRRLLNDPNLRPEQCREYAEKFLALGWWQDALEFLVKCGDNQGLETIKTHCLETGDTFLLTRLGSRLDAHTWRQVAEQALAQGKFYFARRAFDLAGDPDKTAMVEGLIAGAEAESPD